MSIDSARDRRLLDLTFRSTEVEYAKAVDQAALLEQARTQGAQQLGAGHKSFDVIKAAAATELQAKRSPQIALDVARGFLGKLKGAAQRIGALEQALESVELKRTEQLEVVQRKKKVKEVLAEKIRDIDGIQERRRVSREDEALEEIRGARLCSPGAATSELGPNAAVSPLQEGGEPGTCGALAAAGWAGARAGMMQEPVSAAKAGPAAASSRLTPGSYAGRIEQLVTHDSPERSSLSLLLNEGSGSATAVEITRRGQHNLAIKLVAETEGERRRLWARREKLVSALSAAGYNVERVVLAAGARDDS